MKIFFVLFLFLLITGCSDDTSSQLKALQAQDLDCPEGSLPEIQRWGGVGENGWLIACKMNHGTFKTYRGDKKIIDGNYVKGKKEGVWVVWNEDGKKQKETTYVRNKETTGDTLPSNKDKASEEYLFEIAKITTTLLCNNGRYLEVINKTVDECKTLLEAETKFCNNLITPFVPTGEFDYAKDTLEQVNNLYISCLKGNGFESALSVPTK